MQPDQLDQEHVNNVASNSMMVRDELVSEIEGIQKAIQDCVVSTKDYNMNTMKLMIAAESAMY